MGILSCAAGGGGNKRNLSDKNFLHISQIITVHPEQKAYSTVQMPFI
jgi:hypothetical protein